MIPRILDISKLSNDSKNALNFTGSNSEEAEAFIVNAPSDMASSLPFIVSCPHAGIFTAEGFQNELHEGTSLMDVLARGDVFTDWLTHDAVNVGATQIISTVAPSFLNVGRAVTSINPNDVRGDLLTLGWNPDDIYVDKGQGQGLVAVKTLYDNTPIYAQQLMPTEQEIASRINRFYTPYHDVLESKVNENLEGHGYSLLFDIHSCPSTGTPKDSDYGEDRADIIFSAKEDFDSCSKELLATVVDIARTHGYTVAVNDPYKGGFNTQKYARNPSGVYEDMAYGRRGSESLQVEFKRSSMGLDEKSLRLADIPRFLKMQSMTSYLLGQMAIYTRNMASYAP